MSKFNRYIRTLDSSDPVPHTISTTLSSIATFKNVRRKKEVRGEVAIVEGAYEGTKK